MVEKFIQSEWRRDSNTEFIWKEEPWERELKMKAQSDVGNDWALLSRRHQDHFDDAISSNNITNGFDMARILFNSASVMVRVRKVQSRKLLPVSRHLHRNWVRLFKVCYARCLVNSQLDHYRYHPPGDSSGLPVHSSAPSYHRTSDSSRTMRSS